MYDHWLTNNRTS